MSLRRSTVAAFIGAAVLLAPLGSQAQVRERTHAFIPADKSFVPGRRATEQSLNWAGYANTGRTYTGVTTTYVVPTTKTIPGFSAAWAGIGGYGTNDLIQAGTGQDSVPGFSGYYAWYELLPAPETRISGGCSGDTTCTVRPGHRITVTITNTSGNLWSISLTDAGHWSWSKTVSYASGRGSAEWILEPPTVLVQTTIADLGTVTFDPNNNYRTGTSTWAPLSEAGGSTRLNVVGVEAVTSDIDGDGDGFAVCTYTYTCPAPGS